MGVLRPTCPFGLRSRAGCLDREGGYAERARQRPGVLSWLKAGLTGNIRTVVKRINRLRPHHRNRAAYHAHRFPGVTVSELNTRIAGFGAGLGRFGGARAEARWPHVFRIHNLEATIRNAGPDVSRVSAASPSHIKQEGAGQ